TYTQASQLATQTRYANTAGTQLVGTSTDSYDSAGSVIEIKHANATLTTILDLLYTYDAANRLSSENDSGTTTNYQYDVSNQLTQAGSTNYTYDANGNRTLSGYVTGPN